MCAFGGCRSQVSAMTLAEKAFPREPKAGACLGEGPDVLRVQWRAQGGAGAALPGRGRIFFSSRRPGSTTLALAPTAARGFASLPPNSRGLLGSRLVLFRFWDIKWQQHRAACLRVSPLPSDGAFSVSFCPLFSSQIDFILCLELLQVLQTPRV